MPNSFSLIAQAFGWAVLHSLWQIAIIWLVFKAFSWVLRGKNQMIYVLSLASMVTVAVWFLATFGSEYALVSEAAAMAEVAQNLSFSDVATTESAPAQVAASVAPTILDMASAWLESNALLVGWAWAICVVLLWLRLLGGWLMVQRLRSRDVVAPEVDFQERCQLLAETLKFNSLVRLLESPHVTEPLTLGFWKPVILFPTSMLLSLSPAQVEALLLHELAHIRRHDYLINLFQLALETCFFYHPLFWLISRDSRVRREFCCDDVVLHHTDNPILYAQTLTDLQLSFVRPSTQFTMNATGKSRFTERILRIAGISPKRESRPNLMIVMLLPVALAICSWWPTQASSLPLELIIPDHSLSVADSLPPAKAAKPTPSAESPKMKAVAAQIADDAPLPPKVAIEVVKMNVLYIGVDNPIRVAVEGVPSNELVVRIDQNGKISGGNGNYTVQVTTPGEATVTIFQRDANGKESLLSTQKYRVKRIPDPAPRLGSSGGGVTTKEALLKAGGLFALMANFDFDATCEIVGYEITILAKESDPISLNIQGAKFNSTAIGYIEKLVGDGDAIFFDDIKVKCPGDAAARNVGSIAFKLRPAKDGE